MGRAWRVSCLRGGALQDQVAALFIGQLTARLFAEGSGAEHLHGAVRVVARRTTGAVARRLQALVAEPEHLHRDHRRHALPRGGLLLATDVLRRLCRGAAAALAEVNAPVFTEATSGMPLDWPWVWMFAALTTCSAATLTLPETRMPASPASMVPSGAIRSMSPGATSGIGLRVAIPAPVLGTCGDRLTLPQAS